jgi:hypothetical protein
MFKALLNRVQSPKPSSSLRLAAARRRHARALLALDALEDRIAPAVVPLGPLQFEGDFSFDASSSTYTLASGSARLGLAPTSGESFKPLLELEGSVFFYDETENPTATFTVSGGIDVASASPQIPLWQGLDNVSIAGVDLLTSPKGVALAAGGRPVAIDNGSATFTPDNLRFFDPDAVPGTTDALVRLQGGLTVADTDSQLTGLTGTVSGNSQFVVVDPAPPAGSLPGVQLMDATLKSSFALAGLEFGSASFTASYSSASHLGVVVAGQNISFGLLGATVRVNLNGNGMVVKDGAVAGFQMGVVQGFNLLGLKVDLGTSGHPLTVAYVVGAAGSPSIFAMSGDVKVSTAQQAVSSVGNKVFDSVAASFVVDPSTGKPGLEIVGGEVESLNLTVNGELDLFGLTVSAEGLNVRYPSKPGVLELTGGISVEELFKATATFGEGGSAGGVFIDTSTGAVSVQDLTLAMTNVNLGVFRIDDLEVAYSVDPATQTTQFDVFLMMSFPQGWRVAGQIDFVGNKLQEISLEWEASNQTDRIPIGDTGLFLTGMEATVQNISQPSELTVSGEIVVEFGDEVAIFGQTCTLFRAVGGFVVDKDELTLGADVWLGAFTNGSGKTDGVLGSGSGVIVLDWNDQVYTGDVKASLLDGTFTYDAAFSFDGRGDIWIAVDAKVNVPHSVPLIGGTFLASMDFRFSYVKGNPAESYVAAWTEIDLLVTTVDIGFEYTFDTKSVKVIGSHDVKKLRNQPDPNQSGPYIYTQEFDVPVGATSANLSVGYLPISGNQLSISVSMDGGKTFISEADFAANHISKLTQLDTATSKNVSITVEKKSTASETVTYILKLTSDKKFLISSANIASITNDGNGYTKIKFAQKPSDLSVGDFFTVDGASVSGYNVEHAVNAILDDLTVVTDQPFTAESTDGSANNWDLPHFTATFYNPPPTIGLTGRPTPSGSMLQVPLKATVDSAFIGATKVDLYIDTDSAGFDGKLIARGIPYKSDSDGNIVATALANIANLLPGDYYIYAVIDDGTNTPVFSAYSDAFEPQYAVLGTVNNQHNDPLAGWTVFVDVNRNGRFDLGEPFSAPTTSVGFYGIPPVVTQSFSISSITRDSSGNALLTFTSAITGLAKGQALVVTNSSSPDPNTDYNGSYTITAVLSPTTVVIDKAFTANANGGSASIGVTVPINAAFDVVVINLLPDYFIVDATNGVAFDTIYNGTTTKDVDFEVSERSAIQGTVFHGAGGGIGLPGLQGWLVFLDQNQNGRLDPGEAYTTTQGDGSYNFAPFTSQQAGTYYVAVAPPTGASALYTFEDVSGTYLYDSSNSPIIHAGTLVNGPQVGTAASFGIDARPHADPANNVLKLNGSNQFVDVTHHSDLEPGSGAFSAAGWVRFSLDTGFKQMIAGSQDPGSPFEGWSLLVSFNDFSRNGSGDRKLYLDLRQVGTGISVGVQGSTVLENDRWYHVAFTYDPSAPGAPIRLYVNGSLDGSGSAAGLPTPPDVSTSNQVSFNLGNQGGDRPAFPMGGFLDDVGVWGSALSPLQVLAMAGGSITPGYYLAPGTPTTHAVTIGDSGTDVPQTDDSGLPIDFFALAFATISGTVSGNALNGSGGLGPAAPLGGWAVHLLQGGQIIATTTSAADGGYIFAGLLPGDYQIEQVVPDGWRQTSQFQSQPQFQAAPLNTSGLGHWIATGDFDGDGHADLAIPSAQSKEVAILFGKGDGTFAPPVKYGIGFANAAQIKAADLDGDGRLDIAVMSPTGVIDVLFNHGGADRAALLSPTSGVWNLGAGTAYDLVAGDFNNDGKDDLAALFVPAGQADHSARIATLFLGSQPVLNTFPIPAARALVAGDLDNDGKLDLVISGTTTSDQGGTDGFAALYGDGAGKFRNVDTSTSLAPLSYAPIAVADFNGDGRLDVVMNDFGLYTYRFQDSTGHFPSGTPLFLPAPNPYAFSPLGTPGSLIAADFDGDLKPDVVGLPLSSNIINLFVNNNAFGTAPLFHYTLSNTSYWTIAAVDLNGDDLLDLVATDSNSATGASFVLLNKSIVNRPIAVSVTVDRDYTGNDFTSTQIDQAPVGQSPQILGAVFDDLNGNGIREAGESGRAGALVYLDLNRNGSLDPGEPSMITLAGGVYTFGGQAGSSSRLPDGAYQVRLADMPGRLRTSHRQGQEVRLVGGLPDPSGPRSFDFGTIANQVPVVSGVATSGPVVEGGVLTVSATFVDADALGTHTVLIAWGDGTTSFGQVAEANGTGTISASHRYADGGIYEIVVTVIDNIDPTVRGAAAPITASIIGAGVRGGVLQVIGTDGRDQVAIARHGRNGLQVIADFLPGGRKTFDIVGIESVEVFLLAGNDSAQIAGGIGLPVFIDGGAGRDRLKGGAGPALLAGGIGNDTLLAGAGPAVLHGGRGNDKLVGGPGRDILIGGPGADVFGGRARKDLVIAGRTRYDESTDALLGLWGEWKSGRTPAVNISGRVSGPRTNGGAFRRAPSPGAGAFRVGALGMRRGGSRPGASFAARPGAVPDKVIDPSVPDFAPIAKRPHRAIGKDRT